REANGLDEHNAVVRAVFVESLLNKASAIVDTNTPDAGKLIDEAFNLDAANPRVKSMRLLVADLKKTSAVDQYLSRARELHAVTELEAAASEVARGLSAFPGDARLIQLQTVLARTL